MKALRKEGRAPALIVLENVCGALTSHGGKDFVKICEALAKERYRFGALVIDAALFVPQSRPRLFIIAAREDVVLPASLLRHCGRSEEIQSHGLFHTPALCRGYDALPQKLKRAWIWWALPVPAKINSVLSDIVETTSEVEWDSAQKTNLLLKKMNPRHRQKLHMAKASKSLVVGTAFKRMRRESSGFSVQRTEVRFDGLAGCLRTPAGGSSRQTLIEVRGNKVKSRLLSSREAARLMGLPETYKLPTRYGHAIKLIGDGVVVPVVRFLAENLLQKLWEAQTSSKGSERTAA